MIKVNFGCLNTKKDEWINIDKSLHVLISKIPGLPFILSQLGYIKEPYKQLHKDKAFQHIKYFNVTKGLLKILAPDSVDWIYTSHMFHYLFYPQAVRFLEECYTILKPNGGIRILIPDVNKYIQLYSKRRNQDIDTVADFERIVEVFLFKDMHEAKHYPHRYIYNDRSLIQLLLNCGFSKAYVCNFKEGYCPDIEYLDNRVESLIVEAMK